MDGCPVASGAGMTFPNWPYAPVSHIEPIMGIDGSLLLRVNKVDVYWGDNLDIFEMLHDYFMWRLTVADWP